MAKADTAKKPILNMQRVKRIKITAEVVLNLKLEETKKERKFLNFTITSIPFVVFHNS